MPWHFAHDPHDFLTELAPSNVGGCHRHIQLDLLDHSLPRLSHVVLLALSGPRFMTSQG